MLYEESSTSTKTKISVSTTSSFFWSCWRLNFDIDTNRILSSKNLLIQVQMIRPQWYNNRKLLLDLPAFLNAFIFAKKLI